MHGNTGSGGADWSPPRSVPEGALRVSDADRSEVSELLSRHFSDGRLDSAEFDARLERTVNAKTRTELRAVLADLPHPGSPPHEAQAKGARTRLVAIVAVALVLAAFVSAVPAPRVWLLVLCVGGVWLFRRARGRRSRRQADSENRGLGQ